MVGLWPYPLTRVYITGFHAKSLKERKSFEGIRSSESWQKLRRISAKNRSDRRSHMGNLRWWTQPGLRGAKV